MRNAIVVLVSLLALGAGSVWAPTVESAEAEASKKEVSAKDPVDVNTATAEQLAELPGIGEKVAARILRYRESHGSFRTIEEVMNVKGIGEKTFAKIRSRLSVGQSKSKKK